MVLEMGKRVVIKIGDGDFNQGFSVTLQIGEEGKSAYTEISGKLPPTTPRINLIYNDWRVRYCALGGQKRSHKPLKNAISLLSL
jgi:hypothetical protein